MSWKRLVLASSAWLAAVVCWTGSGVAGSRSQEPSPASARHTLVYVGTYTDGTSKGIYVSRLDPDTGALTPPELATEAVNPSWLAVHPSGRFLYAANEIDDFEGAGAGAASAFAIDRGTGRLRLLNQSSTRGGGPCHASLDRSGRHLLVANYGGGSVAVLPVAEDGRLGTSSAFVQHEGSAADAKTKVKPHAHSADPAGDNRFVLVADLGLDRVFVYKFDANGGGLAAHTVAPTKPGAGPRHLALRPDGRFAYLVNERHMTATAFRWDGERGALEELQTVSTLPEGTAVAPGFSGAEVLVHPSGRFVYTSNRGHDTIAVFAVDGERGTLRPVEHVATGGRIPRGVGIDPSGRWLLVGNQKSDRVTIFRIDSATGRLTATGQALDLGAPVAFAFVPAGPGGVR
jgi:6-phosphogluconolactonase